MGMSTPMTMKENLTDPEACEASRLLAEQRQRHPHSRRDLVVSSGLHRSTVNEALHALLVPLFGHQADARAGCRLPSIALLKRGKVQPGRPTWYAADRRAWDWWWPCEMMNSPEDLYKRREFLGPFLDPQH